MMSRHGSRIGVVAMWHDLSAARLARWRDVTIAADPGGFSRRAAVRAVLSLIGTGAILLAAHQPFTAALLGAAIAMLTSVAVTDSQPAAQGWTLALGIAASLAAVCLATVVAGSPLLAGVLLCALVFLSGLARARGARASAVGMLAFMGYFFAVFVGAQPAQVPALVIAIVAGGIVTFVVRFAVVRERRARVNASVLRAFRARLVLLLDDLTAELESGDARGRRLQRIRRDTGRVNEVALALEEAMGRSDTKEPPAEVRPWLVALLDAEVAADMLADTVHRVVEHDWAADERAALASTLRALQRWIVDDGEATRRDVHDALAAARTTEADESRVSWRLERAVHLLMAARPWTTLPAQRPLGARVSQMSFRPGGGGTAGVQGSWPTLRIATQATVAVGLAIVAGRAISTARWYWAVLAAFVVFLRATTFAETLSRAWQRVFGTILGVSLGIVVAALLRGHTIMSTIVALLALFVSYALLQVTYSGMILFVTIALALLYEMMGRPVPGLMALRLAETATGAAIGVIVAGALFPLHSGRRVRRLVANVVRGAAQAIERGTTPGVDPCADVAVHDEVRRVDRALSEARNAVRPLWTPHVPVQAARMTARFRSAAALAYASRRLLADVCADGGVDARSLQQVGALLAENCRRTAAALERGERPTLVPTAPALAELTAAGGAAPGASAPTAEWCADVDAIVRRLADGDAGDRTPSDGA